MLSPAQLAALESAALAAVGTPEMRCQVAMVDIYKSAGLLPADFHAPLGDADWARTQERSLIAEGVAACGYFLPVDAPQSTGQTPGGQQSATVLAQPGDLLGFRLGHTLHHVAISLGGGRMVHVFGAHGVQIAPCIPAPWAKRVEKVWRLASVFQQGEPGTSTGTAAAGNGATRDRREQP